MADATLSAEPPSLADTVDRVRRSSEYVVIPVLALVASALLFSVFLLLLGKIPLDFFALVWRGGFGTWLLLAEHAAARRAADPRPRSPSPSRRASA